MWHCCINLPLIFHEISLWLLVVWFNKGFSYLEWCHTMSCGTFQCLLIREGNVIYLEYDLRNLTLEFSHRNVLQFIKQLGQNSWYFPKWWLLNTIWTEQVNLKDGKEGRTMAGLGGRKEMGGNDVIAL